MRPSGGALSFPASTWAPPAPWRPHLDGGGPPPGGWAASWPGCSGRPKEPGALTFQEGAALPDADGSGGPVLAKAELQQEERQAREDQHDGVGNQKHP